MEKWLIAWLQLTRNIQWIIGAWHPSHWCQQLHQRWMRMLSKMFQITHETTIAMTRSKFPDFSLTFHNIFNFPWPITKFPDNSLTFAWYGISLTFPWPLDTLYTIIGSDNGLLPSWRQAIFWTNTGILLIGPLGTNFSEIFIRIKTFSLMNMYLKVSSAKVAAILPQPQCVKSLSLFFRWPPESYQSTSSHLNTGYP